MTAGSSAVGEVEIEIGIQMSVATRGSGLESPCEIVGLCQSPISASVGLQLLRNQERKLWSEKARGLVCFSLGILVRVIVN